MSFVTSPLGGILLWALAAALTGLLIVFSAPAYFYSLSLAVTAAHPAAQFWRRLNSESAGETAIEDQTATGLQARLQRSLELLGEPRQQYPVHNDGRARTLATAMTGARDYVREACRLALNELRGSIRIEADKSSTTFVNQAQSAIELAELIGGLSETIQSVDSVISSLERTTREAQTQSSALAGTSDSLAEEARTAS